ncbi:class I SAM-dependent methyltransferase [Vibrio parahaemolyticus]|uniref:class I SAM-dependent methyltransferase n=1 Tax=Vibrio parahaemolyticus TaxID=670 RepID=UPI00061AE1FF|nr:class I SAM-dependent methyltransferase [Vibrio parahaemolyticus]EGQ8142938.1 class I SAM-dependent methyltransferase [Vibrio parahaemolyticus]EGQ8336350.1 methyltransferase domain-containing protein [Vibrio parahaemolyticus]EGQ8370016.1 methyltransferase domain-containing protein [Vibrio parahaemolyticus]EGQ8722915.1 methyltransferase domain-containing protein [Vibrio parahaemolyticus]EGQ8761367.1 methyltransferase domain-containing protein [Vibrio parahaemolyticus]
MTIEYYDQNAQSFVAGTIDVNMEELYSHFVSLLPTQALILDAGCGSGRDTKAFLDMGYSVEAIDASLAMVNHATSYTGIQVIKKTFQEMGEKEKYDAIWACASLLHVPKDELFDVFTKLTTALKTGGIWYFSFKYGSEERQKDGRSFTDMNEESIQLLLSKLGGLVNLKTWLTEDARPDRKEKWLNVIVQKNTLMES